MPHPEPINHLANILNTDMYQLTMAVAYFEQGIHEERVTFDLYHRKCPFGGEYTVFGGLDQILCMLEHLNVSDEQIDYLKTILPSAPESFFEWLRGLTTEGLVVHAPPMGSLVFPGTPILRVEGPLALCQLLETPLLNLVNFPSLIATNAARFVSIFPDSRFLEFGLRRSQGPDGALSAARYAVMGGFSSTSNVQAGFNSPELSVAGTMAHSFVLTFAKGVSIRSSFVPICTSKDAVRSAEFEAALANAVPGPREHIVRYEGVDFVERARRARTEYQRKVASVELVATVDADDNELTAFVAFAQIFPDNFLALVDTFDTLGSGLANFVGVATVLAEAGWKPRGIRLDSGDLSYLSLTARRLMNLAAERMDAPALANAQIVASNDINEKVLVSLRQQGHAIDIFGVGTHLVTCQKQPALGCVYKLVQVGDVPRIKLSEDAVKVPVPAKKKVFRLYGSDGSPLVDIMTLDDEPAPQPGDVVLCLHPTSDQRCRVVPARVEPLLQPVFADKHVLVEPESLSESRERCRAQIKVMRRDHTRLLNPTPYKVSVSSKLAALRRQLILEITPIKTLH